MDCKTDELGFGTFRLSSDGRLAEADAVMRGILRLPAPISPSDPVVLFHYDSEADDIARAVSAGDPIRGRMVTLRRSDGTTARAVVSFLDRTPEARIGVAQIVADAGHRGVPSTASSYRELFERAFDAILLFAPEREIVLDVNQRACELYGFTRDEFIGMSLESVSANVARGREQISAVLRDGHYQDFETTQYKRDGTPMQLEINASLVDYGGRRAVLAIHRDVTARKAAEQGLRDSEAQLRALHAIDQEVLSLAKPERVAQRAIEVLRGLVPAVRLDVIVFDLERAEARVLAAYSEAVELPETSSNATLPLGVWAPQELLRRGKVRYVPDLRDVDEPHPILERLAEAGIRSFVTAPMFVENRLIGELNVGSTKPHAFPARHQELTRAVANSIAAAVQGDRLGASIKRQRQRTEELLEHIPVGVAMLGPDGRIILTNPAGRDHLGALGARVGEQTVTELGARKLRDLLTVTPLTSAHELVGVDGDRAFEVEARPLAAAGEIHGAIVVVTRDVTREREVRNRVQEHERLAAVGQLAAGIAHDFNNLLQSIMLCSELILSDVELPPDLAELVRTVLNQARRGARVIAQILDFSRESVSSRQPVDIGRLVEDIVAVLRRTIPENIRVELTREHEDLVVSADPTQIQQALTNLVINSRDAIEAGGEIRIDLKSIVVEEDATPTVGNLSHGRWVTVRVSDNGAGIPDDVLPRVFEPFFTTKRADAGTGLGLAQVYGIVQQHDGAVAVHSRAGQGTVFKLYFPQLETSQAVSPAESQMFMRLGTTQLILVVEDDSVVRRSVCQRLASLGYRTLEAQDGQQGIEMLLEQLQEIELVITDLVMPKVGGMQFCRLVREHAPGLPIIVTSGHPLGSDANEIAELGPTYWLAKPFSSRDLGDAIDRALAPATDVGAGG